MTELSFVKGETVGMCDYSIPVILAEFACKHVIFMTHIAFLIPR